jgi:tetratricopeptide (TPR) repeat protein
MTRSLLTGALVSLALLAAPAGNGQEAQNEFKNLKVLPKDISKKDLLPIMRSFAFAMGGNCGFCHAKKPEPETGYDFASDDKETKKVARLMMQMVSSINKEQLSKVEEIDHDLTVKVQCVTCHHGLARPQTLLAVMSQSIDKDGIDKTLDLYAGLRNKYQAGGQYDFSETTLNQLTEALLAKQKNPEALAMAQLNFSANHPDSIWSYNMLAMAHQANGKTADAIADYRKSLELHPEDDFARKQIDVLSKTTR